MMIIELDMRMILDEEILPEDEVNVNHDESVNKR